jgi:hypothetical protein
MRPRGIVLGLAAVLLATAAWAGPRVVVSVSDLARNDRRLEISAGTEVVWSDPHFERVWFAPGTAVQVERTKEGFRAVFDKPGVYRGLYTIVGGHTSGDVYRMTVTVTKAAG